MKSRAIQGPDWLTKNAVYQLNTRTFSKEGTIDAITKELPFLKELGFNIIYLCPVCQEDAEENVETWSPRQRASNTNNPKNVYRIADYFTVDEEYGTQEDLQKMIEAAHELDMKVLLDLVYVHMGPSAKIIKKYPEFVKQNKDGSFICNHWSFPELDFRNEGLREYLYCNMVYCIGVLDADGFRLDVANLVPEDFWQEARRRIQAIKKDAVLISEGLKYDRLVTVYDSSYCVDWQEVVRSVYCEAEPASKLRQCHEELVETMPIDSNVLRNVDNHDTVVDWGERTEVKAGHDGMEQIEVLNYLIDGIPMVYCGNEIACSAKVSFFANRFHKGECEFTDRDDKYSEASLRRQEIMKTLNAMKAQSDLLRYGKTQWIDNNSPDCVVSFKRVLGDEEIVFYANAKSTATSVDIKDQTIEKSCILSNGKHEIKDGKLYLAPREYVVFK